MRDAEIDAKGYAWTVPWLCPSPPQKSHGRSHTCGGPCASAGPHLLFTRISKGEQKTAGQAGGEIRAEVWRDGRGAQAVAIGSGGRQQSPAAGRKLPGYVAWSGFRLAMGIGV